MADDVAGEVHRELYDATLDALIAFWDAWRSYAKLPEDERSGVAIGEVMDTLARDPQFILTAAEKLLREAGVCKIELPALRSAGAACKSVATGAWHGAASLAEAVAQAVDSDPMKAARDG